MIESDNDTPDTDESDIEDVDFMNDKIGSEQRRIRHREKLEEDKNRKIESRRTWLLKQIKNCERKETVIFCGRKYKDKLDMTTFLIFYLDDRISISKRGIKFIL